MDEYNFQKEEEKFNPIDEMCIKVVNIYKNIINLNLNITGISEDLIRPDIHKQIDYNLVEYCRSAISLKKAKTQKIKKLNDDTMNFKEEVEIILRSVEERGVAEFYDIIKLNCFYYLYKYVNSDKTEEVFIDQIEEEIADCIFDTSSYYKILSLLGNVELEKNTKKNKIRNYLAKIKFLDPYIFNNRITSFLTLKSLDYEQYKIHLPSIDNSMAKSNMFIKNLNYIKTALNILKESESFDCHERYIYFKKYEKGNEITLNIINDILMIKNKPTIKSLNNIGIDLYEEEIEYLSACIQDKSKELIEIQKINTEKGNLLNTMKLENSKLIEESNNLKEGIIHLIEKFNKLKDKCDKVKDECDNILQEENEKLQNKLKDKEKLYNSNIKEIASLNELIEAKINETNSLQNLIDALKKDIQKEKEKIKGIQRRDINSKIFEYFYFSIPEDIRIEKEKLSNSEKVELIIEYMNDNYPYYFKYIQNNKINLVDILYSIINQNRTFNSSLENISESIILLVDSSELFNKYVFNQDDEETNETSNKSHPLILPKDILNDFKMLNEKFSKNMEN